MKKKGFWRKFLKMVLCFPVMPVFGVASDGSQAADQGTEPEGDDGTSTADGSAAEGEPGATEDQKPDNQEIYPATDTNDTPDTDDSAESEEKGASDDEVLQLKMENRLFRAKIQPEFVEDAAILIATRVKKGATEEEAIAGLKKRNPGWFEVKAPDGTGKAVNPRNGTGGKETAGSVGIRLAKQNRPKQESSFFKK